MRRNPRAGVTLIELLIAVTLFSMLSVGMLYAFRIGLMAYSKTQNKLMDGRRVAGAQSILVQEIQNMVPVVALCGAGLEGGGAKAPFFQGEPQAMRMVSTYSLQGALRGQPQILELFVAPGENGRGVRLLVNEIPYGGPIAAGQYCIDRTHYRPIGASEHSFVLADKLEFCRFTYLSVPLDPVPNPVWTTKFDGNTWPRAVRIDMAPLEPDPSRLQPISVTALIHIHRSPDMPYVDN
jgi:prepilin-type N-terminal cleavage/methylation domain-containing protein